MPLYFKGVDATEGTLYVTSKRLIFMGKNNDTTEWSLRHVVAVNRTEQKGFPELELGYNGASDIREGRFISRDRSLVTMLIAAINKVLTK